MLPVMPPAAPTLIMAAETIPHLAIEGVLLWPYARVAGLVDIRILWRCAQELWQYLHVCVASKDSKKETIGLS